jgi:RNA polymerase-binding protein DksA
MSNDKVFDTLKEKQKELLDRISSIKKDFKKGRSKDYDDHATDAENDLVLDEIYRESETELNHVNQAIGRLEDGSYGTCSQCDRPINPERLEALPYTSTCIECAV